MNVLQTSAARPAPESATRARMGEAAPRPLAPARWDWDGVRRVLVVRLRSIGDTVLSTPSLYALRRFLPDAQIDLLLEDWVAPLLDGNPDASRILTVKRNSTASRLSLVRRLRAARYDVAFNLHGGSTAALLTRASGARRRVGYASYRFSRLHNHAAPPATDLWRQAKTHSVEQQLGLLGWAGVPVTDRPATRLFVTAEADARIARKLDAAALPASQPFALFHPAAAFDSKRWDARNFARVAARLDALGLAVVAVAAPGENDVVRAFAESAPETRVVAFNDLALPEVVALAARAPVRRQRQRHRAHRGGRPHAFGRRLRLIQRRALAALDGRARRGRARRDVVRAVRGLYLRRVCGSAMHPARHGGRRERRRRARAGGGLTSVPRRGGRHLTPADAPAGARLRGRRRFT